MKLSVFRASNPAALHRSLSQEIRVPGSDDSGPRALDFSGDGRLWVGDLLGRIWILRDRDGNGATEEHALFADGFTPVQGIANESDTTIYVSDQGAC